MTVIDASSQRIAQVVEGLKGLAPDDAQQVAAFSELHRALSLAETDGRVRLAAIS